LFQPSFPHLVMLATPLEKLQVLVTGVDAAIARDVISLLAQDGASVIAADRDPDALDRLARDIGLYRAEISVAQVELGVASKIKLWEASLAAFGRRPHLMICCCGSPTGRCTAEGRQEQPPLSDDVALSEQRDPECLAALAERLLRPALFLHAEPLRRSDFDRALAVLRHPTLRGVLERSPGRGLFHPSSAIPYVRIASHLYALRRQIDGAPTGTGRMRLVSSSAPPPRRANAA